MNQQKQQIEALGQGDRSTKSKEQTQIVVSIVSGKRGTAAPTTTDSGGLMSLWLLIWQEMNRFDRQTMSLHWQNNSKQMDVIYKSANGVCRGFPTAGPWFFPVLGTTIYVPVYCYKRRVQVRIKGTARNKPLLLQWVPSWYRVFWHFVVDLSTPYIDRICQRNRSYLWWHNPYGLWNFLHIEWELFS